MTKDIQKTCIEKNRHTHNQINANLNEIIHLLLGETMRVGRSLDSSVIWSCTYILLVLLNIYTQSC